MGKCTSKAGKSKAKANSAEPDTAFSYLRFSNPTQARGDSVRRQSALRDAWLEKTGAVLDTTVSLRDEGVSGFTGEHRANPDRHALAAFLQMVRDGRIRRGSYLVVESLDRLSREHIRPALSLLLSLIENGIRVVQLLPSEVVYDEHVEPMTLMMGIMELSRGHSESKMKSERLRAVWSAKKERAAKTRQPYTSVLPNWLELVNGRVVVRPDRAAVVKRIFRLAIDGYSTRTICIKLNTEGVPTSRPGKIWCSSVVQRLIKSRSVLGEHQPRRGTGHQAPLDGEPIPGLFPAVIEESEWNAAQAALTSRKRDKRGSGRRGSRINLFAGRLTDARDGRPIYTDGRKPGPYGLRLRNLYMTHDGSDSAGLTFPVVIFEKAILSELREIDPRDIIPGTDRTKDVSMALAGRLVGIEERIEKLKAEVLGGGEIPSIVALLRTLEVERETVAQLLAAARQKEATPARQAWADFRTLAGALDAAQDQDDARLRLRALIRRVVSDIRVLIIPRHKYEKFAAVQVWFEDHAQRSYLIYFQSPNRDKVGGDAYWEVQSFKDRRLKGDFDLRKPADATRLEAVIKKLVDSTEPLSPKYAARRERIIDLRKKGMRYSDIAKEIGVGTATVEVTLKGTGLNKRLTKKEYRP